MEICFIGDRAAYIPYHANGDINHPDVEYGIVTGMNKEYVFVRFGNEETLYLLDYRRWNN